MKRDQDKDIEVKEDAHKFILYSYWRSSASYRVRIAMALKKLPYEYRSIHLRNGEQKSQQFSQLNPNQTVPVLLIGNTHLQQSLPIIEYLDEVYPNPPLLPKEPLNKAQVRALALMIAADISPLQNLRTLQLVSSEQNKRDEWAKTVIDEGLARFEKAVAPVAGRYCFGDNVTLADLCLVPQVYNAVRFKVDVDKFPVIKRIFGNLEVLDAFKNAHPDVQPDAEAI